MSSPTLYLDGGYVAKNPAWHVEESAWKARQVLCMLRHNGVAPKTVCDVGCGAGEVLKQLRENLDTECDFWGYDISPQAIALAKTRASDRIHFELADFGRETDKFFDLILVLDVIEHLPDYFSFLQKIKARGSIRYFTSPWTFRCKLYCARTGSSNEERCMRTFTTSAKRRRCGR